MPGRKLPPSVVARQTEWCMDQQATGLTLRQIEDKYKEYVAEHQPIGWSNTLSHVSIGKRINDGIDAIIIPAAERARKMQVIKLDRYLTKLEPSIAAGKEDAINAALRIEDRRSKLLGLDVPVRVDLTGEVSYLSEQDMQLRELMQQSRAAEMAANDESTAREYAE